MIDEMVEYGEDYTDAAMVVEGMKSAWEVGKGYPKQQEPEPSPDEAVGTTDEEGADDGNVGQDAEEKPSDVAEEIGDSAEEDDTELG